MRWTRTSGPNQAAARTAPHAATRRGERRHVHHPYTTRNGQISGRSSPPAVPSTSAVRGRPTQCAATAARTAAASHPSEFETAPLYAHHRARALYEHLGWEPTGREQPAEWPPYPTELEYRLPEFAHGL